MVLMIWMRLIIKIAVRHSTIIVFTMIKKTRNPNVTILELN